MDFEVKEHPEITTRAIFRALGMEHVFGVSRGVQIGMGYRDFPTIKFEIVLPDGFFGSVEAAIEQIKQEEAE